VDVDHGLIVKKIEEKMNNMKNPLERQPTKKRPIVTTSAISNFLGAINLYKKDNVHQKDFEENLGLLVIKNYLLIQFIENIWMKFLIMQLYHCGFFLSKKTFNQEMLPNLVEKTKQTYVFPILAKCVFGSKLPHQPRT
jgi:hypothetical protein